MAQQIQFIYLTQSDYDNLTPQTSKIYFTSDTHRIYKGSDLYAATTFDQLNFNSIQASSITVDGDLVSVEGHTHTMSDIEDYEDNTFWITGSVNPQTMQVQFDQSFSDAVEAANAGKHIRAKLVYSGEHVVCPWANVIYNSNGSANGFDFHIMLDTSMLSSDQNIHPYLIRVSWDSNGFYVQPYELAQTSDTPDRIWEAGLKTDSARRVIDESTPVVTGSESQVISQGALTTGVANIAGLKGYRYTNTGNVTNSLTFETAPTGWAAGDVVSIVNDDKYPACATIASISGTTVTFTENLPFTSIEDDDGWDAKLVYVSEKPDVGDVEIGYGAYAEGLGTKALNVASHAEGMGTKALGQYAHAEGRETTAQYCGHAEGRGTEALGLYAHAEGQTTKAYGNKSHAEGTQSQTHANNSHVEGYAGKIMDGAGAHIEGYGNVIDITEQTEVTTTTTSGQSIGAHVEGLGNKGAGIAVHVEGRQNVGKSDMVHVEGYNNIAQGKASHAEGNRTRAGQLEAPAEDTTSTEGIYTHAEGNSTLAKGSASHAEGAGTQALSRAAHAEGRHSIAVGNYAHAEGFDTFAGVPTTEVPRPTTANSTVAGYFTHAEGHHTLAQGNSSHAEGKDTQALNQAEHAEGQYNKSNKANTTFGNAGNTIHSIGIGTSNTNRKNAVEVMQNGKVYIKDAGGYDGTNPTGSGVKDIATILSTVASSSHTHPELSGITQSSITKDTGTFTNLVVTNASLDATSITASGVEVNGGIQASTVSASSATFQTLTVTGEVTMSLSSVDFQNINASSLTVNGSAVSLEGHSHSASEISGLDAAISAATSSFALTGHTHNISDITSLATKVSGLTSSKVEKTNGVFTNLSTTNLVVSSATIDAISIEASSMTVNGTGTFNAVSASTATFGDINVTGTASLSTTNVTASTLTAGAGSFTTLTVGGSNVALEGHGHSIADIEDYEDNTFWVTGSINMQTMAVQVDQSFSDAIAAADAGKHIRAKMVWSGEHVVCPWADVIYNSNGSATGFDFYIMFATNMLNPDTNSYPYLFRVYWGSNGFTVKPYELSETNHDHDDVYASISHSHAISDVTDLSTILSGITSSGVEKDTVTADIGYFRLLSVSGSANFAVNTVSANAVTVNGTEVALSGHTHSVADIDGLSTALGGFASSGHTHDELSGITSTSISKTNGSFNALTASTATFGLLNVTSSATFDITNLVADTITVSDLDLTGTLTVSSTAVSAMTVTDLSVTNTLKLNNKDIATQEYVQLMISQAIGQALASAY